MGKDAVAVRPRLRKARQARPKPTGFYARLLRRAAGKSATRATRTPTVRSTKKGWRGAWVRPATATSQRVIVKSTILRQGHTGHRTLAATTKFELDYLEREGTSLADERGHLYGKHGREHADQFVERGKHEHHHFLLVVSPERGKDLDLTANTRELMHRMERDLQTTLEWCAVNHYDTDHPHSHILIRGADEDGKSLRIYQNYLTHGIRHQAQDIATRELGLRQDIPQPQAPARVPSVAKSRSIDRDDGCDFDAF